MFQRIIARTLVLAMLSSLMLFGLACGGSDPAPDESVAETPEPPRDRSVVLYQYRFQPASLTVPVGTKVTFRNQDPEAHNINIPALDVDQSVQPNQEWSYTFDTEGEFAVGNRFSDGMKFDLTVE